MQEVLRTHQLSFADAARVAIEAEGIPVEVFDEHALGTIGLAGEVRVMVPDADSQRAHEIVADLTAAAAGDVVEGGLSWKWGRPALILLALAFVLGVTAAIVAGDEQSVRLAVARAFLAFAAIAAVTGLGLLVVSLVYSTRERRADLWGAERTGT
jgi:hypothetical protein